MYYLENGGYMDLLDQFWLNPKIKDLFTESKLIYFYLIHSEKPNLSDIQLHTGISKNLIKISIDQLLKLNFIDDKLSILVEDKKELVKTEYTFTKYDEKLTSALFAVIAKTFPNYLKLVNRKPTNKDFSEMNKINRLDGNDYGLIENILRWLYTSYKPEGNFDWKDQIKSVRNLRKHFDSIRILYEKEKNKTKVTLNSYSTLAPSERKVSHNNTHQEYANISPQEAEKNRIILQLIRTKKIAVTASKIYKNKTIDELRTLL